MSFSQLLPTPSMETPRSSSASATSSSPLTRGRRQSLVLREPQPTPVQSAARFGEIAGATAAECAAVCCCVPCGVVGLVVCAVVKLPIGLAKKAYVGRSRRRRRIAGATKQNAMWERESECYRLRAEWGIPVAAPSPEVVAMERVMWAHFYETGFWRSPSRREEELLTFGEGEKVKMAN